MTFVLGNWRFWAAVLVSVVTLALLVLLVDRQELLYALRSADYRFLAPAIALYFLSVYFRSARWKFLLSPVANIPVRRLFPVVVIGYMANNILPARLGELVRAVYLAQREEKIGVPSSIATISVERLYDGLTLLAMGAISAPILLTAGLFDGASIAYQTTAFVLAAGVVLTFAFALVVLTTLSVSKRAVGWAVLLTGLLPLRFRATATDIILRFVEGLATLNSPRKHVTLFLASLPVWLAEAGVYIVVAYSFNLHEYFDTWWLFGLAIVLVTVTSNLVTAIPTSIGGIGPFEVVAQQTLTGLAVAHATAASYSVAVHLVALWLPVNLVGLALLWINHVSLRGLTTMPANSPEPPGGNDPAAPSGAGAEVDD